MELSLPELVDLAAYNWTPRLPQAPGEYVHPGLWSLCHLASGSCTWVVQGDEYRMDAGQLVVFAPGQQHEGMHDIMHRCRLQWFSFAPPDRQPLPGLDSADCDAIMQGLSRVAGLPRRMPALFNEAFETLLASRHDQLVARRCFHLCLALAIGEQAPATEVYDPLVTAAIRHIRQSLDQDFELRVLLQRLQVGRSQFYRRFVDQVGMTPAAFHGRERINAASDILLQTRHNGQTAQALGYRNTRQFADQFKRHRGCAPRVWLQRQQRSP